VWAIVRPMETTLAWLVNSLGDPGALGRLALLMLVPLVPSLFLAAELGGLTAVAWVMVANESLSLFAVGRLVRARTGIGLRALWPAVRPVVIAATLCWIASRAGVEALSGAPASVRLAAGTLAGAAVYLASLVVVDRTVVTSSVAQFRRMLGGRTAARAEAIAGEAPV